MNLKTIMPLGLAIVLGLVAAYVAKNAISKRNAPTAVVTQNKILVAKKDIAPGKQLTAEDVTLQTIPGSDAPAGSFTDFTQIAGRVSSNNGIVMGLPITESTLAAKGVGSGLQALIPPGMRAITIDINETTGIAGMIQPGCMVDVVTTLRTSKGEGSIAKTIAQYIKVTAVGSRTNPNPTPEQAEQGPARSVTLLVTPKDAEVIELAANVARPRLVLRSNRDGMPIESTGLTLTELVGDGGNNKDPFEAQPIMQPQPIIPAPATQPTTDVKPIMEVRPRLPEFRTVTVIRGGTESTVKFRTERSLAGLTTGTDATEIPQ